jgi:hypothetical protein
MLQRRALKIYLQRRALKKYLQPAIALQFRGCRERVKEMMID